MPDWLPDVLGEENVIRTAMIERNKAMEIF